MLQKMLESVSGHASGLDLSFTKLTSLEGISTQRQITTLRLNGIEFTKTAFAELAHSFPSLKVLELRRCRIDDVDFNDLVFPSSMQWLDLRETEIDGNDFCALKRNKVAHPNSEKLMIMTVLGPVNDDNDAFRCSVVTEISMGLLRKTTTRKL